MVLGSTAMTAGGVWRHIADLGLALAETGITVTMGLLPEAAPLHEASRRAGLAWQPLSRTVVPSVDLWHFHLHDSYDHRAMLGVAARRLTGPSVLTEHLPRTDASDGRLESQHPRTRGAAELKTAFKKLEFRLASEVIAVSDSSRRFLEHRYSLPEGVVTTVYNGVAPSTQAAAQPPPGGRLRIVALGTLIRQKGFDLLLQAAHLSKSDWTVTIVGSGPQREHLQQLAAGLAPDRVTFVAWTDDPESYLSAADVVCMPSRWESFPYTALEASALSRPVVGTRVDGLDEIIVDGLTGVLVPPEDPAALAAALDRLAAEPDRVVSYGAAACKRVRSEFTLEDMVGETLAVYARARRT